MIRALQKNDLDAVMQIWLDTNITAHDFIPRKYWTDNYTAVKEVLPQAEVYVYEDADTQEIVGFIGLMENYVAGLFVKEVRQSRGIGAQLLEYAKGRRPHLSLRVYQKNARAIFFYQRERFFIQTESVDTATNEKEFIMSWCK